MANGVSLAVLSGNLTADPELRSERLLTFTVAVNRREKQGEEWRDAAHFYDCKVLGNRAQPLAGILTKGKGVTVLGDLVQERWEKDGQKRSTIRVIANEIVLHGGQRESATGGASADGDSESALPF